MNFSNAIFNNKLLPLNRAWFAKLYKTTFGHFFYNPFTSEMIEKKILFIHIPKTGGSSVASALIGKPTGHPYLYEFFLSNKNYTKDFFKFCVVRNPYDRLVSAYSYIVLGDSPQKYKDIFNECNIRSFSDLVMALDNWKTRRILQNQIVHLRTQLEMIEHTAIKLDKVYKFEDFQYIEKDMNNRYVQNIHIQKLNPSPRSDYKGYYDNNAVEIIKRVYGRDLEAFNYNF